MIDPAEPAAGAPRSAALRVESPSVSVVARRRDAWVARFAVVGGWVVFQGLLSTSTETMAAGCWGTVLAFSALALLVGSFRGDPTVGVIRHGKKGVATVEGGALRVESGGHTRTIAVERITSGWTDGSVGGERVVLETRDGAVISIEVVSAAAAHALLQALGLAPEQRAVAMRVGVSPSRGARFLSALVGLICSVIAVPSALVAAVTVWAAVFQGDQAHAGLVPAVMMAGIFGAGAWLCFGQLIATTVRIGTDGVSLQRLGRRRFIPRAELVSVGVSAGTLVLARRGRDPIAVQTSGADEAVTLERRVREALAAHPAAAPAEALTALDRSGRPVDEWRHAVQALLGAGAGYRRAAIEADALLGVVEDGAARPERRVAAAVALAAQADAGARRRVRVAAEACVSAKLRIAITQAADGEIDEDALAAAEEEAATSRAGG
jgi:hypothetical protein